MIRDRDAQSSTIPADTFIHWEAVYFVLAVLYIGLIYYIGWGFANSFGLGITFTLISLGLVVCSIGFTRELKKTDPRNAPVIVPTKRRLASPEDEGKLDDDDLETFNQIRAHWEEPPDDAGTCVA